MAPILILATVIYAYGADVPGMAMGGSELLKGCTASRRPFGRMQEAAVRTSRGRYCCGSSEIRLTANEFKTRKEAETYVRYRISTSSAMPLYWSANPDGRLTPALELSPRPSMYDGVRFRPVDWTRRPDRDEFFPYGVIAGRIVIELLGSQHPEAKRRDPEAYRNRITDSELKYRLNSIAQFLVHAAMKINSSNGKPKSGIRNIPRNGETAGLTQASADGS